MNTGRCMYPVPYLHPDTARHVLAADEEVPGTHAGVMAAAAWTG